VETWQAPVVLQLRIVKVMLHVHADAQKKC
jgi:hypothetical protein